MSCMRKMYSTVVNTYNIVIRLSKFYCSPPFFIPHRDTRLLHFFSVDYFLTKKKRKKGETRGTIKSVQRDFHCGHSRSLLFYDLGQSALFIRLVFFSQRNRSRGKNSPKSFRVQVE